MIKGNKIVEYKKDRNNTAEGTVKKMRTFDLLFFSEIRPGGNILNI